MASVRAQVRGSIAEARHTGFDGLCAAQREVLDGFWARADVEIEGDTELQQAVRFCLFHVLQSGARAERRAIAAKGLTGAGYDGHAFWDTESFVLPVLTYTAPDAARDALHWRHGTLDLAYERARQLGLRGAAFPWRTIAGRECSGYWPASTSAFHVNADIADAVVRYQAATEDAEFARTTGLDLLVATARLWRSVGHHDVGGGFRIDGVTGPDEYSAIADNNVYTNLMAKRNIVAAADAAEAHPQEARALGVDTEETAAWRDAAHDMVVPGTTASTCTARPTTSPTTRSGTSTRRPRRCTRCSCTSRTSTSTASRSSSRPTSCSPCGRAATSSRPRRRQRDFEYYEALTVRDSSLSACAQSVVAAEAGHIDLAYDYLGEAAFVDLHDLNHNTRDGLHMASLAGCWLALVCGLGGFRDHGGTIAFAPRLPEPIGRLSFRLDLRGRCLVVDVSAREATYRLAAGEALEIVHHGEAVEVRPDEAVTRPVPRVPRRDRPRQPAGREPRRRAPDRPGSERAADDAG